MTKVFVSLDGRTFIVTFGDDGEAALIKERKRRGNLSCDKALWASGRYRTVRPGTVTARVIAAAEAKLWRLAA